MEFLSENLKNFKLPTHEKLTRLDSFFLLSPLKFDILSPIVKLAYYALN